MKAVPVFNYYGPSPLVAIQFMDDLIGPLKTLYLGKNDGSEAIFEAAISRARFCDKFVQLLKEKRMPQQGWREWEVEAFVNWLSAMDSNNFPGSIGVGEREGRIYSFIVKKRHFGFAHGVGRSGNLGESQPKAVGSTLLSLLSAALVKDFLLHLGWQKRTLSAGLALLPCCTGMSITLALLSLPRKRKVIWLRVDQKSCLKAITTAGFDPIVVEGKWQGDELVSDLEAIEQAIKANGPDQIHAIVSCVSCFAPRAPDSVVQIGFLAKSFSIPHIINGAYAAFSQKAGNLVNNAHFDLVVMSLDKNFLVPVSGAVILGQLTEKVLASYPGRASAAGSLDVLITLLEMGVNGLKKLTSQRQEAFALMKEKLALLSDAVKLLSTPRNDISLALAVPLSLHSLLGPKLFYRNVTGARLVTAGCTKQLEGIEFENWCAHSSETKCEAYLNVAVGIGTEPEEILEFYNKLSKLL